MDISPDKENIDRVFSGTVYYIDFYQRDYRWTEEPVIRLLDDMFFKFKEEYERNEALDPSLEAVTAHYPWYYLNTYVTNVVEGKTYVVDGQQRLTTLSLILLKLKHLAGQFESPLADWLESKIGGRSGYERHFWMNHVGHFETQNGLFESDSDLDSIPAKSGITAKNMVSNYRVISSYLDKELKTRHQFETFVFYYLYRLVLIKLAVEQTDVSMVFEVINDRGVKLRPYEILKGKLLGQIDKLELDSGNFNQLWEERINAINKDFENEADSFFRYYLKARFANTRQEGQNFDGDYHREMFRLKMDEKLGLLNNPAKVKEFLKGDFAYYSSLYLKILEASYSYSDKYRGLGYNETLDLDAPYHLLLAVCAPDDPHEDEKLRILPLEIDRFYTLSQIQNAYDSNDFAVALFTISAAIRDASVEEIRPAFDAVLTNAIAESRGTDSAEPLSYAAFRQTGMNLNIRFKRYFLARIEEYLANETNTEMRHSVSDLTRKGGHKNGFHIEHILSKNSENLAHYDDDEERFNVSRNRLGGLLLLKGRDNISSSNEVFSEKLKSYAGTMLWNETLREDSYKSKLDLRNLIDSKELALQAYESFGPAELDERHQLLFKMVQLIWNPSNWES